MTGSKQKVTYKELLEEVETLAGVLREEGVRKGDVVIVYSTLPRSATVPAHQSLPAQALPVASNCCAQGVGCRAR